MKDILGYKGKYAITNSGKVYSYRNKRFLNPWTMPYGYKRVNLSGKAHLVHRLVAKTFVPNPNNLPYVDHIDGNPDNNRASNLRWCSHYQNVRYTIEKGRHYGTNRRKLTQGHIEKINMYQEKGYSPKQISIILGVKYWLVKDFFRRGYRSPL